MSAKKHVAEEREETLRRQAEETNRLLGFAQKLLAAPRQNKTLAAAIGLAMLAVLGTLLWAVTIRVRHPDGKETSVTVPDGSKVAVNEKGDVAVTVKAASEGKPAGSGPAAPPLAIAPFDVKKAKEHQETWAKHLGVPVEMTNSIGMKLVFIPPGEFDMGSTEAEVVKLLEEAKAKNFDQWYIDRLAAEAPKHRVRITKPFWLGVHEVTRGQFRRFVDDRGYKTEAERDGKGGQGLIDGQWKQDPRFVWNRDPGFAQADDHPVVNVSWNDVTAFCAWLSEKEGEKSQLPSEAQWEYACRAGTATTWYSSDDVESLKEYGWFDVNSEGKTHPVGQKWPNAWGLYDMHGNVWEWCQDWFGDRYYATSPLDDPQGPSGGSFRVRRGGGRGLSARFCRSAHRDFDVPVSRGYYLGLRVSRVLADKSVGQAPPDKQPSAATPIPNPSPRRRPVRRQEGPRAPGILGQAPRRAGGRDQLDRHEAGAHPARRVRHGFHA